MNEVSCRAITPYLDALDARGIPRDRLVTGLDVTLSHVARPANRIDWDVFVAICARLEALVGSEHDLVEVTSKLYQVPGYEAVAAAVSLVASPLAVYRNMYSFVGPSLFHNVESEIVFTEPDRVRITLTIPPAFADCPPFFWLCVGGFEAGPITCGYAPAEVRLELAPRRGVFNIRVDDRRVGFGLLKARIRRFFLPAFAMRELDHQRDELRSSFDALRVANEEIGKQRRRLAEADEARRVGEQERARLEEQFHRAQKLEGLGLLAGGVAHDFNNLLTGIIGNAELAMVDLPRGGPTWSRVDHIERLAARAADLTAQLLAYAGRRPPASDPLDVSALVGEMSELLRTVIPRAVDLRLDLAPRLPAVAGDAGQLQQVVMNLLTNAADAAKSGGGVVCIRTAPVRVTRERLARSWLKTDAPEGDYVQIEVRDDGIGMDEDTLARIFDPFFTTKGSGRGLGLSAVLGIVTGHGAVLEVDTRRGEGTAISILLPSLGRPAPAPDRARAPDPAFRGAGTVLVADDEDAVLQLLSEHLRGLGFDVILAADGQEAVDAMRLHHARIVLVVLDRTMPRMSGEAAFREIRRIDPGARVILSSGYDDEAATNALRAEGLAGTLRKPYRVRDLITTVRAVARAPGHEVGVEPFA